MSEEAELEQRRKQIEYIMEQLDNELEAAMGARQAFVILIQPQDMVEGWGTLATNVEPRTGLRMLRNYVHNMLRDKRH